MSATEIGEGRRTTASRRAVAGLDAMRGWLGRELRREAGARSAFALWPIGMGFGIALVFTGDLAVPLSWAWGIAGAAALTLGLTRRSGGVSVLLILLAAVALGQALAQHELARTRTTILSGDVTTRLTGRVVARESDERGRQRYVLDVLSTERPQLSRPPERVRVWVAARHEPLPIAGTFRGVVRLRPPPGPAYPGAYDFAFAPFFEGLGAYGFALGTPLPAGPAGEPTAGDRLTVLRLAMGERIRAVLPGAAGAVASALITGERAGVPDEIEADLRTTSLAHILSISGFHMALVASFVVLTLRTMLAAVPRIALHVATRKLAALGALGATAFYFALSGDNAATERSFIMIALMLGAVLIDRPALTLRNVAMAALVVMAITPHAVLTATFQMSFAATAALVGAFGAYTRWRAARDQAAGRPEGSRLRTTLLALTAVALSSLIAGAATAPYGVYHFHRVAPFGVVANLIATPLFTFWIMPLALISALAMPFGLETLPLKLTGFGLDVTFTVAHQLALWLPDQGTGRITAVSLAAFTLAILALSFFASRLRWSCIPLTVIGLVSMAAPEPPDLVLFEDGRELAIRTPDGGWSLLQPKPNRFVTDQWTRGLALERIVPRDIAFRCSDDICRGETRGGLRVAWTDKWEQREAACRDSDIAIVARAIRQTRCEDGTPLVTLRTLRLTGSLGINRTEDKLVVTPSISPEEQPWNAHRNAPWPERWRRPADGTNAPADTDR